MYGVSIVPYIHQACSSNELCVDCHVIQWKWLQKASLGVNEPSGCALGRCVWSERWHVCPLMPIGRSHVGIMIEEGWGVMYLGA